MATIKSRFLRAVFGATLPFCPLDAEAKVSTQPDVETSSRRYQKRFRGRSGKWFLDQQQAHLLTLLEPWPRASILDVGGGHGQYTRELISHGYHVTVLGSSAQADAQIKDLVDFGYCRYLVGDLTRLPVAAKSFDVIVSFRLMAHLQDWRAFIHEAARVARRAVIVDYPVLRSFNALYPACFWLKRACEGGSTRTFTVFKEKEILDALSAEGMHATGRRAEYFLPMVFHRMLHMAPLSMAMEKSCGSLGLTRRFGSPVILRAEPDVVSAEWR